MEKNPTVTKITMHAKIANLSLKKMHKEEYKRAEKNKKIKKAWPLRKTPQNDGYVYKNCTNIINMHVCNTTNSFKYKRRRMRRRRIAPVS